MAQARELVGDGHELLGQFFKPFVIGHQRFDLRRLLGGHTLGELLALDVALQDIVGTLRGLGVGAAFSKELAAEGAAAESVDSLDLLEDLLAALLELGDRKVHGVYCISIDTTKQQKITGCGLLSKSGYFFVSHPKAGGQAAVCPASPATCRQITLDSLQLTGVIFFRLQLCARATMKDIPRISEAEWEVMKVVWAKGPCSAGEIVEALVGLDRRRHPKTIKTYLGRLTAKKALGVRKEGRGYIYRPLVTENECVKAVSESFLGRVFGGSLRPMLAHFVEQKRLSSEEIQELKRLLDKKES